MEDMKAITEKTKDITSTLMVWVVVEGPQLFVTLFR